MRITLRATQGAMAFGLALACLTGCSGSTNTAKQELTPEQQQSQQSHLEQMKALQEQAETQAGPGGAAGPPGPSLGTK